MSFIQPIYPCYVASGGGGTWTAVVNLSLPNAGGGNPNLNYIEVYSQPFSVSGSHIRLTLSADTNLSMVDCYAGHQGSNNAYSFDGTQVQITSGGSATFTVTGGVDLVTDSIAYSFNSSVNFLVAFRYSAGSTNYNTTGPEYTITGADVVPNTNKSGGTGPQAFYELVKKIEVL